MRSCPAGHQRKSPLGSALGKKSAGNQASVFQLLISQAKKREKGASVGFGMYFFSPQQVNVKAI